MLHYGGGSIKRSGLYDEITKILTKASIPYVELGGVKPNPRSGLVYEGIELCKKGNVDFILAVGGGSTIDSSKAIAAGSVYDGDFMDFYRGKKTIEKALPVGTILTIAAAGSEGSANTVITDEETQIKKGAQVSLLRPEVFHYGSDSDLYPAGLSDSRRSNRYYGSYLRALFFQYRRSRDHGPTL